MRSQFTIVCDKSLMWQMLIGFHEVQIINKPPTWLLTVHLPCGGPHVIPLSYLLPHSLSHVTAATLSCTTAAQAPIPATTRVPPSSRSSVTTMTMWCRLASACPSYPSHVSAELGHDQDLMATVHGWVRLLTLVSGDNRIYVLVGHKRDWRRRWERGMACELICQVHNQQPRRWFITNNSNLTSCGLISKFWVQFWKLRT